MKFEGDIGMTLFVHPGRSFVRYIFIISAISLYIKLPKQFPCILGQIVQKINPILRGIHYNGPPKGWLTCGPAVLNSHNFLACDW